MKRLWMIPAIAAVAGLASPVRGDDAAGVKQTIEYVKKLQTSTGGFTSIAPRPNIRLAPTLRATSAAVRALKYWGGAVPDQAAAVKFVESCWDPATGGFSDFPRGKPDVFTTAVGVMAVAELKMPTDKIGPAAVKFLSENAKTFEDMRIAAAGLERLNKKAPRAKEWLAEIRKLQGPDGRFGKGPGQARAAGGSIVTLLRLGGDVSDGAAIVKVLKDGQRRNGGYGKDTDEIASDLETTYRVMRCFVMLKARPANVEGVRSFVAKCRNEDGGYGMAPGEPSNVTATYFAGIIRYWLEKKE
ncbi:MAG: terpene cyclase/mutase family protein [Gemmataceae bacterium]|nr:terpene cyclase/mutase family protein [Gemmataceae bacterium]